MKCSECGSEMIYISENRAVSFEGKEYYFQEEYYKCLKCGHCELLVNFENEVHSEINRRIKEDNNLLQSDEITRRRIACGVGRQEFWDMKLRNVFWNSALYYGVEGGVVQTKEQDNAIRNALESLENETEGKRKFPLWMWGCDFRNELEPQKLYWALEMLCLGKATTEEELVRKLIYYESHQHHHIGTQYRTYQGQYFLEYSGIILDYMANVLKKLEIKEVNGKEYYISTNEPEFPRLEYCRFEPDSSIDKRKQQNIDCLEMLRSKDKIDLILRDDYLSMGLHYAHRFSFEDIT